MALIKCGQDGAWLPPRFTDEPTRWCTALTVDETLVAKLVAKDDKHEFSVCAVNSNVDILKLEKRSFLSALLQLCGRSLM